MTTVLEQLAADLSKMQEQINRLPFDTGIVTATDLVGKTVTVDTGIGPLQEDLPIGGVYMPAVGDQVTVWYGGQAPLVLSGGDNKIQSHDFATGSTGWGFDASGNFEANDGIFRGALQAARIGTDPAPFGGAGVGVGPVQNPVPNQNFDVNATGWAAGATTTIARVTTPTQAGAGALALTQVGAGGVMSANTPLGNLGVDLTEHQQHIYTGYVRSATTGRTTYLRFLFFDAAGTYLTNWNAGSQGQVIGVADNSAGWTVSTVRASPPPNARYYALQIIVLGAAAGEIHYLDSLSGPATVEHFAFCPDVQPGGIYVHNEPVIAKVSGVMTVTPTPGYYDNFGSVINVTGYAGSAIDVVGDVKNSAARGSARVYAAFYTAGGVFISAQYSARGVRLSTSFQPVSGSFKVPSNAVYGWIGIGRIPNGDGILNDTMSSNGWDVYPTTLFDHGVIDTDVALPSAAGVPTGSIIAYSGRADSGLGATNPIVEPIPGYLIAAGQAVSRTIYADLFAVLGTGYGVGDGSTTFNLPDFRGRVPVGLDNQGGVDGGVLAAGIWGQAGGSETHTLTTAEIPAHQHLVTGLQLWFVGTGFQLNFAAGTVEATPPGGFNSGFAGGGGAHNNMQPYRLVNYLIKT